MTDRARLEELVTFVADLQVAAEDGPIRATEDQARDWVNALCRDEGARYAFTGAHELRLAGIHATCTQGRVGMLRGWLRGARRRLEREPSL